MTQVSRCRTASARNLRSVALMGSPGLMTKSSASASSRAASVAYRCAAARPPTPGVSISARPPASAGAGTLSSTEATRAADPWRLRTTRSPATVMYLSMSWPAS